MRSKSLLLGALAAFAYYKYSKMSKEDKDKLVSGLKEKGRQFMDQLIPGSPGKAANADSYGSNRTSGGSNV
jgi:hypothetical protein